MLRSLPRVLTAGRRPVTAFFQRNNSSFAIPPRLKKFTSCSSEQGNYHYIPQENTAAFYTALFESKIVQQEINRPGSIFHKVVSEMSQRPLVITHQGDKDHKEKRFSYTSLSKVIMIRDKFYENPHITDLYYLHELGHARTRSPSPELEFNKWARLTEGDELQNSFMSEALIYFDANGLRERSLNQEIWVDAFLNNKLLLSANHAANKDFYHQDRKAFINTLFFYYLRSYSRKPHAIKNENEKWLTYYRGKTKEWHGIWESLYVNTDTMIKKYCDKIISPVEYLQWLEKNTKEDVLFYEQSFQYVNGVKPESKKLKGQTL